jgi:hypothetical protein
MLCERYERNAIVRRRLFVFDEVRLTGCLAGGILVCVRICYIGIRRKESVSRCTA